MALQGAHVLLWGPLSQSHDAIHEIIFVNDGQIAKEYSATVTHVISSVEAAVPTSKVIESARASGAAVVLEGWLHASVEAGKLYPVDDFIIFQKALQGCNIAMCGDQISADWVISMMKLGGGSISLSVNKNTTHVLWGGLDGSDKILQLATSFKVPVVTRDWLRDSIEAGVPLSERLYEADTTTNPGTPAKPKKSSGVANGKRKHEDAEHEGAGVAVPPSEIFAGLTFCVTGAFAMGNRKKVEAYLEEHGAAVKKSVTKDVTHLIASTGQENTAKYLMAKGYGLPIVTEQWMKDMVAAGVAVAGSGGPTSGGPTGSPKKFAKPSNGGKVAKKTGGGASASVASVHRLVKKGKCAVDPDSMQHEVGHVLEEGANVYSVMLNQTNIANNNNKFYLIQLIAADSGANQYWVWNKWGRVGMKGQSSKQSFTDKEKAKKAFMTKFKQKTKNDWADRSSFVTYKGKYTIVGVDAFTAGIDDDDEDTAEDSIDENEGGGGVDTEDVESKLDPRVQELVKLLCDVKKMEAMVIEMSYDVSQVPLGKLKKSQISKGSDILRRIEELIKKGAKGKVFVDLSNDYYTLIPHTFGMRRPPVLNNMADLAKEIRLMEALGDIEIAKHTLSATSASSMHPIDRNYHNLNCNLKPVDKKSDDWKIIDMYVRNTHAPTHDKYHLEVVDVFEIDRPGEKERYAPFSTMENRKLLWHGSRLSNYVGILSQGLRIAPPEAPVTGYMFGKGLYFADMSSKSANYCWATKDNDVGCVILSEVALGNPQPMRKATFLEKPAKGYDSVFGVGGTEPHPDFQYTREDGVIVPLGKATNANIEGETDLLYNEYVVYKVSQAIMRFIIMLKFKWVEE